MSIFLSLNSLFILFAIGCKNPDFVGKPVPIATDQTTRLDFSTRPWTQGGAGHLEVLGNMAMRWDKEGIIAWEVDVPKSGNYKVSLSYASVQAGAKMSVYTDSDDLEMELIKSTGPFFKYIEMENIGDLNMEDEFLLNYTRQSFTDLLHLEAGVQEIFIEAKNMDRHEVIDFRALELTPVDIVEQLASEEEEALSQRASTDWMVGG